MATLSITIPDNIMPRVLDGFCTRNGYKTTLDDGSPNPMTRNQFFKQTVIVYIKQCVREAEIRNASTAAADAAAASVDTDILLS